MDTNRLEELCATMYADMQGCEAPAHKFLEACIDLEKAPLPEALEALNWLVARGAVYAPECHGLREIDSGNWELEITIADCDNCTRPLEMEGSCRAGCERRKPDGSTARGQHLLESFDEKAALLRTAVKELLACANIADVRERLRAQEAAWGKVRTAQDALTAACSEAFDHVQA